VSDGFEFRRFDFRYRYYVQGCCRHGVQSGKSRRGCNNSGRNLHGLCDLCHVGCNNWGNGPRWRRAGSRLRLCGRLRCSVLTLRRVDSADLAQQRVGDPENADDFARRVLKMALSVEQIALHLFKQCQGADADRGRSLIQWVVFHDDGCCTGENDEVGLGGVRPAAPFAGGYGLPRLVPLIMTTPRG